MISRQASSGEETRHIPCQRSRRQILTACPGYSKLPRSSGCPAAKQTSTPMPYVATRGTAPQAHVAAAMDARYHSPGRQDLNNKSLEFLTSVTAGCTVSLCSLLYACVTLLSRAITAKWPYNFPEQRQYSPSFRSNRQKVILSSV